MSELASVAGVTVSTTSLHLRRLDEGGLVRPSRQGRHRYFALSGPDVASVLEALMGLAQGTGATRVRTGPRDADLRRARICYDHLAGEMGVAMLDSLRARDLIAQEGDALRSTDPGRLYFEEFGIDLAKLEGGRRALCRGCLDWSMRRDHLAGALGAALWQRIQALGWARRLEDSRVIRFTPRGETAFRQAFGA